MRDQHQVKQWQDRALQGQQLGKHRVQLCQESWSLVILSLVLSVSNQAMEHL